jgi:hypothetical protein
MMLQLRGDPPLTPLVDSAATLATLLIFTHVAKCRDAHMHAKRTRVGEATRRKPEYARSYSLCRQTALKAPADLHLLFDVNPGLYVAEMLIGGGPIVPCLQVAYKGQRSGSAQLSFPNEAARVRIRSRPAGSSPSQTVKETREVVAEGGCCRRS